MKKHFAVPAICIRVRLQQPVDIRHLKDLPIWKPDFPFLVCDALRFILVCRIESGVFEEETDLPELNSQNHAQHQNNQVSQKEKPIRLDNHLQESEHSVNPLEEDFLSSFRNLTQEEQQSSRGLIL
ncbi:Hypothetical predicted protein [Podarcis lilfordi]|uniref:Uncharacterized protein n=1 Tax=Podarcis lilfordi TaxID=74358 RepID=A0AA35LIF6_9SAUR|nr:Hypothetical predicted protein [Podarcis lilfordi]